MNRLKYRAIAGLFFSFLQWAALGHAEQRPTSGCMDKPTISECFSCYLDYADRMHTACINQNPGVLDLQGEYGTNLEQMPLIRECEANLGAVTTDTAQLICNNAAKARIEGKAQALDPVVVTNTSLPSGDEVPRPTARPTDHDKKTTPKTTTATNNSGKTTTQPAATTDPSQVQAQISADQAQCAGCFLLKVECGNSRCSVG